MPYNPHERQFGNFKKLKKEVKLPSKPKVHAARTSVTKSKKRQAMVAKSFAGY